MHPNFFLLDSSKPEENIKIDQVRNLLKFLNKSVYPKDIKLVLIDNVEYLNINSSNALLNSCFLSLKLPFLNSTFWLKTTPKSGLA